MKSQKSSVKRDSPEKSKKSKKSQKYSRKLEHKQLIQDLDFLKYPPQTQDEFRSILLEFLVSNLFTYPIHSQELFQQIIALYKEQDIQEISLIMKDINLLLILTELSEGQAIKTQQYAVGTKIFDYILDINQEKIKQLCRKFYKDRPKQMPQIEKQILSIQKKNISNEFLNNFQFQSNLLNNLHIPNPPSNGQQNFKQEIDNLLSRKTGFAKVIADKSEEINMLMNKASKSEELALQKFRKSSQKIDFCGSGTKEKCDLSRNPSQQCPKAHFRKIIKPHTDISLGNCSYLDTCRHMDYCKFVHYQLDTNQLQQDQSNNEENKKEEILEEQWINFDIRKIDFRTLGKFEAIMADPPWDIHMNLPYETMKDKEMKALRIDLLQDNGLIFLWVTGRAMELGRECLHIWGYSRVEEIIWVKTNQLQRIIRTGRTGHWLNHSKEHCLVGIKGNPKLNANIDCDVIVSEVRETSRKPDEIYGLIERMLPGGRKLELYGRPLNCKKGWLTLGNQLPGFSIVEEDMKARFREAYPEIDLSDEAQEQSRRMMEDEKQLENIYNSHITFNPPFKIPQNQNK